jgi:hypothetical protein
MRVALLELVGQFGNQHKARELSWHLTRILGSSIAKSEVNRLLYRLMDEGVVQKDENFRWSLCSLERPVETCGIALSGPSCIGEKKTSPEGAPFSPPIQIGHWMFSLNTEANSGRIVWTFCCQLCGVEAVQIVRSGYAVWLWPRIRTKRVSHDEIAHPDTMGAQAAAERTRFGSQPPDSVFAVMPMRSGTKATSRQEPSPVDELVRVPLGRKLMRGFSILKGNR